MGFVALALETVLQIQVEKQQFSNVGSELSELTHSGSPPSSPGIGRDLEKKINGTSAQAATGSA